MLEYEVLIRSSHKLKFERSKHIHSMKQLLRITDLKFSINLIKSILQSLLPLDCINQSICLCQSQSCSTFSHILTPLTETLGQRAFKKLIPTQRYFLLRLGSAMQCLIWVCLLNGSPDKSSHKTVQAEFSLQTGSLLAINCHSVAPQYPCLSHEDSLRGRGRKETRPGTNAAGNSYHNKWGNGVL